MPLEFAARREELRNYGYTATAEKLAGGNITQIRLAQKWVSTRADMRRASLRRRRRHADVVVVVAVVVRDRVTATHRPTGDFHTFGCCVGMCVAGDDRQAGYAAATRTNRLMPRLVCEPVHRASCVRVGGGQTLLCSVCMLGQVCRPDFRT